MNVLVGIGNSDNRLTQQEWVAFLLEVKKVLRYEANAHIHGDWHSYPDSIYQNAAWCVEVDDEKVPELKGALSAIAHIYRQEAIAWNEMTEVEFLGPKGAA